MCWYDVLLTFNVGKFPFTGYSGEASLSKVPPKVIVSCPDNAGDSVLSKAEATLTALVSDVIGSTLDAKDIESYFKDGARTGIADLVLDVEKRCIMLKVVVSEVILVPTVGTLTFILKSSRKCDAVASIDNATSVTHKNGLIRIIFVLTFSVRRWNSVRRAVLKIYVYHLWQWEIKLYH